jgi:hypothetical protein
MRSRAIVAVVGMSVIAQASYAAAQDVPPSPLAVRVLVGDRANRRPDTTESADTIPRRLAVQRPNPLRIATSSSCGSAQAHAPNSAVSRALALLGDDTISVPIVVEHTVRPPFVMSVATAWTDGVTIFINDQSEPYQRARKDAIALAGAIAHESYHLRHGPDEASAYAEQLRVMRRLGASRHDLDVVERGLHAVQLANQPPTRKR